ncbi:P-loop containing nucleoside triphosphate hydrolase [Pseudocohnilembus persalinus]|uniref:p-loop containing nucleoside triphosphate hydrolase n=1 Tax=Pseudocohnilembus persalinus TaxID=266149 RepID=A0A0V0RA50_PSEPJ|nr:P-loop containing nucleoside triphosphate hydrolase [Pseudocohnilembus persalinus]|eukprot:KRX11096.1 P-loop containing nucleoside triphosphate hydrolase [Pseudocohnilembus persalinus]
MSYDYLFKYIIIGDSGVGKSSLLLRFMNDKFNEQHEITVGVEFGSKTIVSQDQREIKLQIWDTAGQEDFMSITRSYYRSSAGALVVYDVTRKETFKNVMTWLEEARSNGNPNMTYILIGNKSDLESEREVSYQEGENLALENNMIFIETSAKNNKNVQDVFMQTAEEILSKIDSQVLDPSEQISGVKMSTKTAKLGYGSGFENSNIKIQKQNNQNSDEEGGPCQC